MPLKGLVQKLVELKQINVNNKEKYYPFDAVLSSVSSPPRTFMMNIKEFNFKYFL